jgi:cyclopropane fatty-acyl-phospholipid synthase-like methyltransferase
VGEDDALLAGQIEYYRARAPEYDEWFQRRGHYDHGPELAALWERELAEVHAVLEAVPLDGVAALELAPGSGWWTERYVDRVASLTAVDASPEMVERARMRLGPRVEKIDWVFADIFTWTPSRRFDAVIFCFWISHVPRARLDAFLRMVAGALEPGGQVFFVDGQPADTSGRADRSPWERDGEVQHRELLDGRSFAIVKNHWPADELAARFAAAGLAVEIHETATYFQCGTAAKAPGAEEGRR